MSTLRSWYWLLPLSLVAATACGSDPDSASRFDAGGGGGATSAATGTAGGVDEQAPAPEPQPEPAAGDGLADPLTNSLHNHHCGGTDWQHIGGWLLLPHAAPDVGPADEIARCVDRYAGWVSNEADAAGVSRASVYAALAAAGQCDADADYDGDLIPAELCTLVHPDLDAAACLDQMASTKSFGIATLAAVLAAKADKHDSDIPLMAALLGHGSIACGGADRWQLQSPDGWIDRYVAAYNAYHALDHELPQCSKHIVVTVAQYTGMDDPGTNGVAESNGCWTYERVAKSKAEWKICNYDGTVHHPDGVKWAYDDTSTNHTATLDKSRIQACKSGVPGRGYVYMTNRGSGWPKRVTNGVTAHFAELYSSQYTVNDQQSLWVSAGTPGQPMVNFGEPTTGQTKIHNTTASVCNHVADGGYLGVYIYPEPLRANRMNAMVNALNQCTK